MAHGAASKASQVGRRYDPSRVRSAGISAVNYTYGLQQRIATGQAKQGGLG